MRVLPVIDVVEVPKVVKCLTEGCTTLIEQHYGQKKYCDTCKRERARGENGLKITPEVLMGYCHSGSHYTPPPTKVVNMVKAWRESLQPLQEREVRRCKQCSEALPDDHPPLAPFCNRFCAEDWRQENRIERVKPLQLHHGASLTCPGCQRKVTIGGLGCRCRKVST